MKKKYLVGSILLALGAVGTTVMAADLANLDGQSCGSLTGTWHFVNNQTGGDPAGTLTYQIGTTGGTAPAMKINRNNQHFIVTGSGELISASTNLPGRLVLSDFTCEKKDEEPPK